MLSIIKENSPDFNKDKLIEFFKEGALSLDVMRTIVDILIHEDLIFEKQGYSNNNIESYNTTKSCLITLWQKAGAAFCETDPKIKADAVDNFIAFFKVISRSENQVKQKETNFFTKILSSSTINKFKKLEEPIKRLSQHFKLDHHHNKSNKNSHHSDFIKYKREYNKNITNDNAPHAKPVGKPPTS